MVLQLNDSVYFRVFGEREWQYGKLESFGKTACIILSDSGMRFLIPIAETYLVEQ